MGYGGWHTSAALPVEGDTERGLLCALPGGPLLCWPVQLWQEGDLVGGGGSLRGGKSKTGHPGRWQEQRQNLKGERGPLVLALLSIKCLSQVRVWANCCAETIRELTGLSPALQKPGTKDRPSNPPELQPRWEAAFLPLGKVTRVQAVAPSPMGQESPPFPLSVETWSPLWLPLQA